LKKEQARLARLLGDHVIEYDWYIETAYISLLTRMC
jgi:hypothetical protein